MPFPHPLLLLAILALLAGMGLQIIEGGWLSEGEGPLAAQVWLPTMPQDEIVWLAGAETGPAIGARAAILLENVTGTVLFAKNAHEQRAPASTTKILTALLALERGRLDDLVTVSRYAASTPGSSARLYTGQKIRMEDLLHGLLLSSGNDAAVAVAEHLAGSESAFVGWMNQRAAALGAKNSRFQNPHGLDKPGHFSTAYDLALLSRLALLYPKFAEIVRTKTYSSDDGAWTNTNQLLWQFEGAEGIKTGTTSRAGYCLVASVTRNGMQLIAVVLDAGDRYVETRRLLEYGFNEFHVITLADVGDVIARLPLADGMEPVVAVAGKPVAIVVRDKDVGRLSTHLQLAPELRAPVRRGDPLGTYEIFVDGELVKKIPLIAAADVVERTPWQLLKDWLSRRFRRAPAEPSPPSGA